VQRIDGWKSVRRGTLCIEGGCRTMCLVGGEGGTNPPEAIGRTDKPFT